MSKEGFSSNERDIFTNSDYPIESLGIKAAEKGIRNSKHSTARLCWAQTFSNCCFELYSALQNYSDP